MSDRKKPLQFDGDNNDLPGSYIASVRVEAKNGVDGFMGEHFEGLGDTWHALFGKNNSIEPLLPTVVNEGKLFPDCQATYQNGAISALLQYPEQAPFRIGALVVKTPESEGMKLWSCCPVMEGLPNRLVIGKTHTWENHVEGVVAAKEADGGSPVTFFAPFYFRDKDIFASGGEQTISLAALALSLGKAELQEFTVDEGPLYESRLQEFLEENPGKSQADFTTPVVSMRGCRILMPSKYVPEWQFRCPVLNVETISLFGHTIHKMQVIFVGMDDQEISGYLYASEHVLNGYVPQAGDDIQGVLWMSGALVSPPFSRRS